MEIRATRVTSSVSGSSRVTDLSIDIVKIDEPGSIVASDDTLSIVAPDICTSKLISQPSRLPYRCIVVQAIRSYCVIARSICGYAEPRVSASRVCTLGHTRVHVRVHTCTMSSTMPAIHAAALSSMKILELE